MNDIEPPSHRWPRLAAVATSWHHRGDSPLPSHAQVILGRWLTPQPADAAWGWHGPRTSLASIYVEQLRPGDEVHDVCAERQIPLAASIDEALTLGGDELAVEGVLLIGEHGIYPRNRFGQKQYPRKALFDQIVATFKRCGQSAPVFCDKHFSWNFDWAAQMVSTARDMGFLLFGGSSIPHCDWTPPPPNEHPPREVVCAYHGHVEDYGFHTMELVQSYIERRPGGETGVERIVAYGGDALAQAQQESWWPRSLHEMAVERVRESAATPQPDAAFVVTHTDGLRVTYLHFPSGTRGWGVAVQPHAGAPSVASPRVGGDDNNHGHFARLARVVQDTILANRALFPTERTLLATGILDRAMRALATPGQPVDTPELIIPYQAAERDIEFVS